MTKLTMTVVLLVLCMALASAADDPCTAYSELPRAVYRGGQCNVIDGKETCDSTLRDGWYRAVGLNKIDLEIQTTVAVFATCGTKFPYWMNGSHPTVAEQEVDRTVCQTDLASNCHSTLNIKVKNCTGFYVYQLKHTPACSMAYCFGSDEPCPPFDPCDVFEHTSLEFEPGRSAVCGSISNTCDSFDVNRWYKFETSTGYMNVSTTCPNVTNACGSPLSIWINGTTQLSNGTNQHVACVKDETSCCSSTRTLLSKQCKTFRVFSFGNLPNSPCQRVCTENVVDPCPVKPTMAPTVNDTQNDDPCTTYSELPRASYRGGQCDMKSGKETCDVALQYGWYRAIGVNNIDLEIQTTVAVFATCGTKFPYWMTGSHPTVAEQKVDRTVCKTDLASDCDTTLNIKVKNCTDFYVYQLKPTPACSMAYCFGSDEPCPPFDPCDVFEHTSLEFEPGRSAVCGSISNTCDSFDVNRWYKFETSTGYLNVSTTCPNVTNACGSPLSIWINGTTQLSNGTNQHVACVKDETSCCSSTRTLLSKQCKTFRVFSFGTLPNSPCQRVCTENVVDPCPVKPTMAPTVALTVAPTAATTVATTVVITVAPTMAPTMALTVAPTEATTVNDTHNDGSYAVKNGERSMMLYYLCCVLVVLLMDIL